MIHTLFFYDYSTEFSPCYYWLTGLYDDPKLVIALELPKHYSFDCTLQGADLSNYMRDTATGVYYRIDGILHTPDETMLRFRVHPLSPVKPEQKTIDIPVLALSSKGIMTTHALASAELDDPI